jgi:hypothetical protein
MVAIPLLCPPIAYSISSFFTQSFIIHLLSNDTLTNIPAPSNICIFVHLSGTHLYFGFSSDARNFEQLFVFRRTALTRTVKLAPAPAVHQVACSYYCFLMKTH